MSLGDEWAGTTPASTGKLNNVTITYGTGDYLNSLNKTKHKLVVCTATGSGLTINHIYLASADGEDWIDLSSDAPHTHSAEDDGGSLIFVYQNNPEVIDLNLTKTADMLKAGWVQTVTSTGTIEDHTDGSSIRALRLRPNATSGSGSTISYPYPLNLDFSLSSIFVYQTQIETATSLALHAGVNADDVTAADSNTRKYNVEVCTTTNNNWFLRTANGTNNSTSDTGTVITANKVGHKILHSMNLGTPEVSVEIDAGSVFQKTTHIPTDGSTTAANLVKFSIKNSTAADRPYKLYGCRISFTTNSSWGYG